MTKSFCAGFLTYLALTTCPLIAQGAPQNDAEAVSPIYPRIAIGSLDDHWAFYMRGNWAYDAAGNSYSMDLSWSLTNTDKNEVLFHSEDRSQLGSWPYDLPSPIPGDDYVFRVDYDNLFRGQPTPSFMEQRFVGTDIGEFRREVGLMDRLGLFRFTKALDTITGDNETVQIVFNEPLINEGKIFFDRGLGWEQAEVLFNQGTFQAVPPLDTPGTRLGLRVEGVSIWGDTIVFELPGALKVGHTRQVSWVVDNEVWQSRIVLVNRGTSRVPVTLVARDRAGRVETTRVYLENSAVQVWRPEELFDMSGYNLAISDLSNSVYATFLTFARRDNERLSPAQTTAAPLTAPESQLLFANLKGKDIPAVVLSAPHRNLASELAYETPVQLALHSAEGKIAETQLMLKGAQPKAHTLQQIFPGMALPDDAWLVATAEDQSHLAGTSFSFNQDLETSMSMPVGSTKDSTYMVLPWVVNNTTWRTELTFFNREAGPVNLTLDAHDRHGETASTQLTLQPGQVLTKSAGELFPDLDSHSIYIQTLGNEVAAALRTINLTAPSGDSPSQVTASTSADAANAVLFGYLPMDQTPAIVLSCPNSLEPVVVDLQAYGPPGFIAKTTVTLDGRTPMASLVRDLFKGQVLPRDVAVVARAEGRFVLTGSSFAFNSEGEPSMSKPQPLPE